VEELVLMTVLMIVTAVQVVVMDAHMVVRVALEDVQVVDMDVHMAAQDVVVIAQMHVQLVVPIHVLLDVMDVVLLAV
jgi:hypothetical protein